MSWGVLFWGVDALRWSITSYLTCCTYSRLESVVSVLFGTHMHTADVRLTWPRIVLNGTEACRQTAYDAGGFSLCRSNMALRMTTNEVDGTSIVALDGRIVLGEESQALRVELKSLTAEGKRRIVLNMDNVKYIDSAGLGILVAAHVCAKAEGALLKLTNLGRKFQEVLQLTKLLTVFDVYSTQAAAIASFPTLTDKAAAEKPSVTLPGTVEQVIESPHARVPEKVEISVQGADELYQEIRIDNTLRDEHGDEVRLKEGAVVEVTVEATAGATKAKVASTTN